MEYKITTRQVPGQRIVSVRGRVTRPELSTFVGRSFDLLFRRLGELHIAPNAEPLAIYHEWTPDGIDVEVGLPVAPDASIPGDLDERVLPDATVAQTLHVGRYEDLMGAYLAVASWIRGHGYEEAGPSRERYLVGPEAGVPEADYWTLIETPVTKALVVAG